MLKKIINVIALSSNIIYNLLEIFAMHVGVLYLGNCVGILLYLTFKKLYSASRRALVLECYKHINTLQKARGEFFLVNSWCGLFLQRFQTVFNYNDPNAIEMLHVK